MPHKGLDQFAVEINLRVLVVMNLKGQLGRDGVETEIAAQPNLLRMPGSTHLGSGRARRAKSTAALPPFAIVKRDLKPVVRRFVKGELPDDALAAVGIRHNPGVRVALGLTVLQLEFRPALGQAGDELLLDWLELGLQFILAILLLLHGLFVGRLFDWVTNGHMVAIALTMSGDVTKERQHGVVVPLRNRIDFVIVAARAADCHPKKRLTGRPQYVVEIFVSCQFAISRFIIPNAQTIKTSRSDAISITVRQEVAGQLLLDEAVVRLVLIEGADDIVTIFPD